jgi:hypothetical protein
MHWTPCRRTRSASVVGLTALRTLAKTGLSAGSIALEDRLAALNHTGTSWRSTRLWTRRGNRGSVDIRNGRRRGINRTRARLGHNDPARRDDGRPCPFTCDRRLDPRRIGTGRWNLGSRRDDLLRFDRGSWRSRRRALCRSFLGRWPDEDRRCIRRGRRCARFNRR